MPLNIDQLQEMLNEHRQKLDELRQAARTADENGRRQALEEACRICDQLVWHLQTELHAAKKAQTVLAH